MRIKLSCFFFVLIFVGLNFSINAQSDDNDDRVSWSIYYVTSHHLESRRQDDRWSERGIGGGLLYQFKSGLGINARLNFREWERFGFDKSTIPFYVGPFYELKKGSKISFAIYGGVGPSFIWGNDYGAIFGSFDLGTRIYWNAWDNNQIFIQFGFAQGMSFHPGSFNYLDFAVGLRL